MSIRVTTAPRLRKPARRGAGHLTRLLGAMALTAACQSAPARVAVPSTIAPGEPNRLSAAERDAGWRLLFDGRSLAGWHGLGYPAIPAAHWTVEDGAIKKIATRQIPMQDGRRPPGGDLITDASFGDFELSWEWKVTPVGNSGVKYNVSEALSTGTTGSHSATGFEYQMLDDARHSDGRQPNHQSAALYDLIVAGPTKRLKPVGEWNHSVIVFVGDHGEHWLNGEKVVEYDLGSPSMTTALAASKYAPISWFATRRVGQISLQDHGDEVYFRSLKLRERRPR